MTLTNRMLIGPNNSIGVARVRETMTFLAVTETGAVFEYIEEIMSGHWSKIADDILELAMSNRLPELITVQRIIRDAELKKLQKQLEALLSEEALKNRDPAKERQHHATT